MQTAQKKQFWQSPNFLLAVIIVIGGFFVGFPQEAAGEAVAALFALIGTGGILYKFFKSKPAGKAKPWLQDANFWNYLSVIGISLLPEIAPALLPPLQDVTENLLRGNYGGALMGAISLITIIIKIIQTPKPSLA